MSMIAWDVQRANQFMLEAHLLSQTSFSSMEELVHVLRAAADRADLSIEPRIFRAVQQVDRRNFGASYVMNAESAPKEQTCSAPYIHLLCAAVLSKALPANARILEIGSGTGIMAAVLARTFRQGQVISCDRHIELVKQAKENCKQLKNLEIMHVKSKQIFPLLALAPFDALLISAQATKQGIAYLLPLLHENSILLFPEIVGMDSQLRLYDAKLKQTLPLADVSFVSLV